MRLTSGDRFVLLVLGSVGMGCRPVWWVVVVLEERGEALEVVLLPRVYYWWCEVWLG